MTDINPAAVMVAHPNQPYEDETRVFNCAICGDTDDWPCEPYRLAEALAAEIKTSRRMAQRIIDQSQALAAEQGKVARVKAALPSCSFEEAPRWTCRTALRYSHDWCTACIVRDSLTDQPEQAS